MESIKIQRLDKLDSKHKDESIKIFIDGFRHLFTFANDDILFKLFEASLNDSLIYVAIQDDKVIGFMGIANNKVRPFKFDNLFCKELFGKIKGNVVQKQLGFLMERQVVFI